MSSPAATTPAGAPPATAGLGDAPAQAAGPRARMREDLMQPDALLDCLLELCRLQDVAATRASLAAGLPMGPDGRLGVELLERAAGRAGLSARLQRTTLQRLNAAALPAILLLRDERACVITALDERTGQAQVLWPETGQGVASVSLQELASRYTGIAFFARPQFRLDARSQAVRQNTGATPAQAPRQGHWFWSAVLSQRLVYRDILAAALLVNLFALAMPMFTMNVYDRVVPNRAVETLWALGTGVVVVLLADLVLRLLRSRFVDEASARIDVQLSASLMERVLGMRLESRPESVGSFAANLRGFEQVRDFIASSTVTTLIDLPFALLFLVVVAWISPWLALPVLGAALVILGTGWVLQKRLQTLALTTHRASAQRNATLVEAIGGIETIKAQGAEGQIQSRWERNNAFLSTAHVQMRGLTARANYGTNLVAQLTNVLIVLVGVYLINERELTMGALVACTMLASRALAPAGQVVGLLMQYQGAKTALDSLNALMAQPQERPEGQTFIQRAQLRGEVEFRNVSFAYPGRQDKVLDNVSFKIAAGEHVAFIGRVGSGKSTVQRLMMGLYQPTEGAVLLDGIDLRQLDPADVRRNQAYVSQDVNLFYGSLRENITFGTPYATDEAVVHAAQTACLADFVNRHPQGFDLPVGERGERLSGGQRQCVGLARAVLHNAPILLLDEPTSAMDFSTESQVTTKVGEFARDKTLVLVTHRTSMLAQVHRVIVVDGGRIVADGPRERIMEALAAGRIARAA